MRDSNDNPKFAILTGKFLSDIANKCDIASRNRRLGRYGVEATDVYCEVVTDICDRLAQGSSLQDIVDSLLSQPMRDKRGITDTSVPEAHNIAFALLCNNTAERYVYRARKETPSEHIAELLGAEVKKEQTSANTDDKPVKVKERKGRMSGIHRADVHAVSDFSRGAMKDNYSRFISERTQEFISAQIDILSAIYTPSGQVAQNAWNWAFRGESVADVIFGLNPADGTHRDIPTTPYKPLVQTTQNTTDKAGKRVKPGLVLQKRTVNTGDLLDEANAQRALRRALPEFAQLVHAAANAAWRDYWRSLQLQGQKVAGRMHWHKVGQGTPDWTIPTVHLNGAKFPTEPDSGKEARRWAGLYKAQEADEFVLLLHADTTAYEADWDMWNNTTFRNLVEGYTANGVFVDGMVQKAQKALSFQRHVNEGRNLIRALSALSGR